MATLRNKRKLAAVTLTRKTQEEYPRNGQSRNTSVPRISEEYITQVSEEIEGRVSKKLSQEFSRTESRNLGALTKLDEFLSNQQIHTHFETVPGTFRNTNVENQGTNEDDSQSDPHPEAGIFRGQTTQSLGPQDCRDRYIIGKPLTWRSQILNITMIRHTQVKFKVDQSLSGIIRNILNYSRNFIISHNVLLLIIISCVLPLIRLSKIFFTKLNFFSCVPPLVWFVFY